MAPCRSKLFTFTTLSIKTIGHMTQETMFGLRTKKKRKHLANVLIFFIFFMFVRGQRSLRGSPRTLVRRNSNLKELGQVNWINLKQCSFICYIEGDKQEAGEPCEEQRNL